MKRPEFEIIKSGAEFNKWYWLKDEMAEICKQMGLPTSGRKFDLRDRIIFALDNEGRITTISKKKKAKSKFNWAKSELTLETKITDNVSFGPNFRKFFKNQIGDKFSCHSDFMDWVKANEGKTLLNAIEKWTELEKRKKDPEFRRKIADNNMYNQYIRDFMDDNPGYTVQKIKKYWLLKRKLPAKNGFVRYDKTDLELDKSNDT